MKKGGYYTGNSAARKSLARAGTPRYHFISGLKSTLRQFAIKVLPELIKINKICVPPSAHRIKVRGTILFYQEYHA